MTSNTDKKPTENEMMEGARRGLAQLGMKGASVYHHGAIVRIQVPAVDFDRALQMREIIVARMKAIGYRYVALDLEDGK
ncbi:hypothetical protein HYR99_30985 [Candidatus Poribacteria bacterium]|nr:hypothetical protein [Candidatus Poribacteria bacterium]